MRKLGLTIAAALALIGGAASLSPAAAQNFAMVGGERYFRFDWEPGEWRGRPNVRGWLFNDWNWAARYIKIRVESLDASGRVTATTYGDLKGWVMPYGHEYFEVPVPAKAPAYRVSIAAWEWMQRGGGTGGSKP
jgi:hypothetical protein